MNEKNNPCSRDCPDRTETCHCTCGRYAYWKRICYLKRKKHEAEKQTNQFVFEGVTKYRNKIAQTTKKGKRFQ